MIYLLIYLVSFPICYHLIKSIVTAKGSNIATKESWNYGDVRACIFFSIFIWIGVLLVVISMLLDGANNETKPPKWL